MENVFIDHNLEKNPPAATELPLNLISWIRHWPKLKSEALKMKS